MQMLPVTSVRRREVTSSINLDLATRDIIMNCPFFSESMGRTHVKRRRKRYLNVLMLAEILARWLMKRHTLGSILASSDFILLTHPTAVWVKKPLAFQMRLI